MIQLARGVIMNSGKYAATVLKILMTICLAVLSQTAYAGIAGNVQFVSGNARLINVAGQSHAMQKGDVINESDTITTEKGATAQVKMRDGGLIVIRPDSQLKFDSFIFNGEEDGNERSFFSLLKGGLRAITGLIGQRNKNNYRIATAFAVIGIRGTDHETFVVTPGSSLVGVAPVGIYNKVNLGETTMTTEKGTISILPNQMGFTGGMDQIPQLQPINLNLFTVSPAPLSQTQGSKGTVRNSVVVDSVLQEQDATSGNTVQKNPIQLPIKSRTGGQTAPQLVF